MHSLARGYLTWHIHLPHPEKYLSLFRPMFNLPFEKSVVGPYSGAL
jgi:hypothetical protein